MNTEDCILLIVDVQPKTIKSELAKNISDKIVEFSSLPWSNIYAVKWFSDANSTFHLSRGTILSEKEAGDIDSRLDKKLTCGVFKKQAPSSFINTKLSNILMKEQINGKKIIVVGFDYDDCILSTVLDGHSRNLRIYAVDELCGNAERTGKVDDIVFQSAKLLLQRAGCLISINDFN